MLNKKIILPFAALAMASFVACGDDSSSSPSNGTPSTTPSTTDLPASVPTLEDAINLTCSQTVNMCVKVYVEEDKDTVQCNGTLFTPMTFGKPVEGCEKGATSTPATDEPATENPGAGEEPAGPGAGEDPADPGAGEQPAAGGDVIYCIVPGVMGGCEPLPAAMKDQCETLLEGQLVDACPAE